MNQNASTTNSAASGATAAAIERLKAPFDFKDLGWKIQARNKDGTTGLAVAYVDSRAIQRRLDEILGVFGWKNNYTQWHGSSQLCGISIYNADTQEWLTKYDGAENTDIEPIKGGLSDAFKRAAVLWGIGRYIYEMDGVWVDIEAVGKGSRIKDSEKKKLENAYQQAMTRLFGKNEAAQKPTPQTAAKPVQQQATAQPVQQALAQQPAAKSAQQPTQQTAQQTAPVQTEAKPAQKASPTAPAKKTPAAAPTFTIKSATPNGNSTLLELVAGDGEVVTAYAKNSDTPLTAGISLYNAAIEQRQSANGAFNVVSRYQLAA